MTTEKNAPNGIVLGVKQDQPPGRMERSQGHDLFVSLVWAIKADDQKSISNLRESWDEIKGYVERHDEETDLNPEKQAVLILWLSTPPSPKPMGWTRQSSVPSFVFAERVQRLSVATQLWKSWHHPEAENGILAMLRTILFNAGYQDSEAWMANATDCFSHSFLQEVIAEITNNSQLGLDILAGYGAILDQRLADDGVDLTSTRIDVLGSQHPPCLRVGEASTMILEELGEAIEFRSRLDRGSAETLARAITLSLPAHADVLPSFTAEIDLRGCRLVSTRERTR